MANPDVVTARSMALPRALPGGVQRRRLRVIAIAFLAGVAVAIGWTWLRDSSLVAVEQVVVTGATGPEAANVRRALETAARDMSTLHVRRAELETAAAPYPIVESITVRTDFPHGLRIMVHEHDPVAAVIVDGRRTAVAADGTILRGTPARAVPVIPLTSPPAGDRVTSARGLRSIALLAAAPAALRARVARVSHGTNGLTAALRNGPPLYFGSPDRLGAKWSAAARVLSDPTSAGTTYLDVRVPERPAAGGLEQIAPPEGEGTPPATAETATTPSGTPDQPSTGG
jgi:cell division protein FtsQ